MDYIDDYNSLADALEAVQAKFKKEIDAIIDRSKSSLDKNIIDRVDEVAGEIWVGFEDIIYDCEQEQLAANGDIVNMNHIAQREFYAGIKEGKYL